VRVRVLGPSRVEAAGGDHVDLGARRPRSILAALALRRGTDVPAETVVDLVWGGSAPPGAHGTLHSYISGLRRSLEPELKPRERPTVLVTTDRGYRLDLPAEAVDSAAFADAVRARHRDLAPLAGQLTGSGRDGWPDRMAVSGWVDELEDLLSWWTGEAYADLPDHPEVEAARAGLEQLRLQAEDDRVLGLLALGDHATVVAATEQSTARNPLRESTWALHALALVRSGRQADALEALRQVRTVLADELGIDPGQELRDLEQRVLQQDARLLERLPERLPGTTAPTAATPAATASSRRTPRSGWRTVGRVKEETALREVLELADAGTPSCALLVGEAGIGKTRLVEELATEAAARGFAVAVGRCSSDEGAPPLWPWAGLLHALAADDGTELDEAVQRVLAGVVAGGADGDDPTEDAFRTWEALGREVTGRSLHRPVLLVLDDLHWGDATSLRVLAHLLNAMTTRHRLAVVVTRRPWPTVSLAQSEVDEALARRHVTRLDLTGLAEDDTRALVSAVSGTDVPAETAEAWRTRAAGNPFFLVELARASGADEALSTTLTTTLPATVRDVVLRRVGALPERTQQVLLDAAVLGRRFSIEVLARVVQQDVEEVDAHLQPARDAGLVVDVDEQTVAFSHALTRDAVAGSTTALRLARRHAAVAHVLEHDPEVAVLLRPEERTGELARHWLAAGPTHVGRAWRAAVEAASQARRRFSHEDAADLLGGAVEAHRRDPLGTPEEHIDLLLTKARDHQSFGDWFQVVDCAFEAIALARHEGDPVRMAEAAAALTDRSIWLPHGWNQVHEDAIDDLRWGMRELPAHDSPERCRLMLALAVELYYDADAQAEMRALVDEGLALARRLDDDRLTVWACRSAWMALWTAWELPRRTELSTEALAAARRTGDPDLVAVSLANAASDALEACDRRAYEVLAGEATRLARRRRLLYVNLALGWVEMYLAGMRDDDDWLQGRRDALHPLVASTSVIDVDVQYAALQIVPLLWREEGMVPIVDGLVAVVSATPEEMALDLLYTILPRIGRLDDARDMLARRVPHRVRTWTTGSTAASIAETVHALGDREEAAWVRDDLAGISGQMVVSGISAVNGPVDGYLALAEATLGDLVGARAHADHALAQAEEWELPRYTRWLTEQRTRGGF